MTILPHILEKYITNLSEDEPNVLSELYEETHRHTPQPTMLSAHYQGRLLSLISRLMHPRHILEIGTYTGYSAICLAEGLTDDGVLHTIDNNKKLVKIQDKYFKASGYKNQIIQHLGKGVDIIPNLEKCFNLAFIDADKINYPHYFDLVIEKMVSGGCILSDNILWKGQVFKKNEKIDSQTQRMIDYNSKLKSDSRISHLILPVRDGLSISFVK